uniref:UDP-glucose--hexose-1-phosphate uridylyltransferase n=1 Tax=Ningiella ruwaisensis TaxID=2364274 RepID=UPI00109FBB37|nr:UDP-glucose--hexose-1-phosphate uridylyltransferase [Ningiella ruwaisensis]
MVFDTNEHPHRRYNPLSDEWILVSPHRNKRPWQGKIEPSVAQEAVEYDPNCYLCPGNLRVNGNRNPNYKGPFVFDNDFSALASDAQAYRHDDTFFVAESVHGISRVVCFSEDHGKSLAELDSPQILAIIKVWNEQYQELGQIYPWVQIFENKGAMMGCSNPHPHGQIWAHQHIPSLVHRKQIQMSKYYEQHQTSLLLDYAKRELESKSRVVYENDDWLVAVPYWASWPYETLLLPKFAIQQMTQLSNVQAQNLADSISVLTCKYDNLFECSFPYSMGWHCAPFDQQSHPEWQLHAHFYPPLLRSSSVRKFMVGYEMLAEAQRDLSPEQAAETLRQLDSIHYLKRQ